MIDDSKMREALEHWTPRFLANGVDYNDLQRILLKIQKWDDWCVEWPSSALTDLARAKCGLL